MNMWWNRRSSDLPSTGGLLIEGVRKDARLSTGFSPADAPPDRGLGRLSWADTDPTVVAYGTPAIDVLRT
jgi:hypothetical protein